MIETKFKPCVVYEDICGFANVIKSDEPILWDGPHFLLARDVSHEYKNLFAAAPEMYEALLALLETKCPNKQYVLGHPCAAEARAALAKAEGRA